MLSIKALGKLTARSASTLDRNSKARVIEKLIKSRLAHFSASSNKFDSYASADISKAKIIAEQESKAKRDQDKRELERAIEEGEVEDVVPEVFREHRHKYSTKPADLDAYKRQLMYRCGHIGTKELEIILSDWLKLNMHTLSY